MDREAFIDAIRNDPADNTVRLVFADWLDDYGETDWDAATAEFCRLCFKRLKFERVGVITDDDAKAVRRKVPGWREWLCSDQSQWWRLDGKPPGADRYPPGALFPRVFEPEVMNWNRLMPSFWSILDGRGSYRRAGRTAKVRWSHGVDLEFDRGFLSRAVFIEATGCRHWLQAIMRDQPFCQPGIVGQPYPSADGKTWWLNPRHSELRELIPPRDELPKLSSGKERARYALAVALKRYANIPEPTPCKST